MRLRSLVLIFCLATIPVFSEMAVYFAPNGGWARLNNSRKIKFPDGSRVAPTLNNAVMSLIKGTQPGGQIKMAMYAFSDEEVQDALIEAAFDRDIRVKVILDGVAEWTKGIREAFLQRVRTAREKVEKKKSYNFQVRVIHASGFRARGRTKRLKTGEEICGTMHEKFGVFYEPGRRTPFHAFSGSSNLSPASNTKFGENRFVFLNEPVIARQYAEEFARLWNEYGTEALETSDSEPYIPAEPVVGGVRIIFNGEPLDEETNHPIDKTILDLLDKVRYKDGTIDIMMFSFTHFQIGQKLLETARRFPNVKIRLLMDQSQLVPDEEHRGILGPYLEEEVTKLGLKNFEIKYKWRGAVFGWDATTQPPDETTAVKADPDLDGVPEAGAKKAEPQKSTSDKVTAVHWRSLILHHKVLLVNGRYLAAGSYNWSSSAERRNLENIMIFTGGFPGHQEIVDGMAAEFETLWKSDFRPGAKSRTITEPQVITGPQGRKLVEQIRTTLSKPHMRPLVEFLDRNPDGKNQSEIVAETGLPARQVANCLGMLVKIGFLFSRHESQGEIFGIGD